MRLVVEWGRKGRHKAENLNEALRVALEAVTKELAAEREAHGRTKEQLKEALEGRLVARHRAMGAGRAAVEPLVMRGRKAVKMVEGGEARWQLGR